MKKGFLTTTFLLFFGLMPLAHVAAQDDTSEGQVYVVKNGDGLYKLARQFFGSLRGVSKIVKAHNEKAVVDERFEVIDRNKQLEIGQLLWIPVAGDGEAVTTQKPAVDQNTTKPQQQVSKPAQQTPDKPVVTQKPKDPEPQQTKPITTVTNASSAGNVEKAVKKEIERANEMADVNVAPRADQATIVTVPKSNCDIRIWYNYQVVAIARLNERWTANGVALMERAKKAYQIRHNARVNGRFMMADRFEVATLRDRDNKKYGNPDGPTFEYLVKYHSESGFEGNEIYERIIESSARTSPVFNNDCKR